MTTADAITFQPVNEWFQPVLDFANAEISDPITSSEAEVLTRQLDRDPLRIKTGNGQVFFVGTRKIAWADDREPATIQRNLISIICWFGDETSRIELSPWERAQVSDIDPMTLLDVQLSWLLSGEDAQATLLYRRETQEIEAIVGIEPNTLSKWCGVMLALFRKVEGISTNRCALPRCNRFFIGTRRKRYCCAGHGSQVRVKRKRLDDQRRRLS